VLFRNVNEHPTVVSFLQSCYSYSEEYIYFGEFAGGEISQSDVLTFFNNLCALARNVCSEAAVVKKRHDALCQQFGQHERDLASAFSKISTSAKSM
jgi:hypothetical protein